MLETLLYPNRVAVIGASRKPGKVGHEIVANLIGGGYAGEIIPINPAADDVLGLPCYASLRDAHEKVDMSVIAVPSKYVKSAIEDSISAGVRSVIVISAGFKETGTKGAELEREIADLCAKNKVRLLGPNCLGLINTQNSMNASFASEMPLTGGISVLSQSGALCTAILDWAASRGVGLAKLVSMGNKADISETDFLAELGRDEHTSVIACYLESIDSGTEFIHVAETTSSIKPVIVLKSGITQAGVKAASSHTGSLAGADIAYGAAFARAGVIRADNFESLFDYATAFAMQPLPKGRRVAIITNAGGPGIMAADAIETAGMEVAQLDHFNATALRDKLPAAASVGNPIDVLGDADPERYAVAVEAALNDPSVDGLIVILTPQAMTRPAETAKAIASCVHGDKPVLASFMGGRDVMPAREQLLASSLPDYPAPGRAVAALKAMCDYAAWRNRPPRVVTRFPVNRRRVERILARYKRTGLREVGEFDSKSILRAYDFVVPEGQIATTIDQAVEVADRMGYPVAMKIVSPQIIHKSDMGGVRLNLMNADQVRDAYDLMMLRIGRKMPEAKLDGVYVEQMCKSGREVILGMTRDPQFGPMLMFGLGGIFVEVMKDVTFHLAPITANEALEMLKGTRSYALLKGARGQAPVDVTAIAGGLQRISQLVTDFPQIIEMDINPFMVSEVGIDPVVADARMTLAGVDRDHD
ncbi:MAG: acetate--CoA ligase family protein [Candidatus Hydrogenedentes bacterium]|nr:acetate--CoA ligase family protein [Candidatus Hydrogenedentota bacterium]